MAEVDRDPLTGLPMTGHEWDGIRELNTPLPNWWIYIFWATVVWSIGYWVLYPAWPSLNDHTRGVLGYSSRAEIAETMEAVAAGRERWDSQFAAKGMDELVQDRELLAYAMAGGRSIFAENCAPCHGAGGAGARNFPVLADDDWLWGGTPDAIADSIRYGIRSDHAEARQGDMPRFGADGLLTKAEIAALVDTVLALGGKGTPSEAGRTLFADNCAACHGERGEGNPDLGAPNLADGIWLRGSSREAIAAQIADPVLGVMPAWVSRLGDVAIKQVAIYVHALGGGQ